jgi:hypothetical protein
MDEHLVDGDNIAGIRDRFAIATRVTVLERDLVAATEAMKVAKIAKDKHDDEHNNTLELLKKALTECVTEPEYTRRHESLVADLRVERDFRNRLLGVGLFVSLIWPIIVAVLVSWLRKS